MPSESETEASHNPTELGFDMTMLLQQVNPICWVNLKDDIPADHIGYTIPSFRDCSKKYCIYYLVA